MYFGRSILCCLSSAPISAERLSVMFHPFKRTPRPNSWIICAPSPRPTFMSVILETRQLLQPSVNLRDPSNKFTRESTVLISLNNESLKRASCTSKPCSSHSFNSLAVLPILITPKGVDDSPARRDISPCAPVIFSRYSLPPWL